MDPKLAYALALAVVPFVFLLVARGIATLIKPLIPDGAIKRELYRR